MESRLILGIECAGVGRLYEQTSSARNEVVCGKIDCGYLDSER